MERSRAVLSGGSGFRTQLGHMSCVILSSALNVFGLQLPSFVKVSDYNDALCNVKI